MLAQRRTTYGWRQGARSELRTLFKFVRNEFARALREIDVAVRILSPRWHASSLFYPGDGWITIAGQ
jgi:hypothetical protein